MSDGPRTPPVSPEDARRRRQADEALRRVRREPEAIGRSAFSSQEPVPIAADDRIELWGKRIGRALGAIVVVYLVWQLAQTLLSGH